MTQARDLADLGATATVMATDAELTTALGSAGIPSGDTAGRPADPTIGDTYYNGELGLLEIYDGANWVPCSSPAAIPTLSVTDIGTNRPYTSGAIGFTFTAGTNGGSPYGYTANGSLSGSAYSSTSTSNSFTLEVGGQGSYSYYGTAYNGFGTSPSSPTANVTVTTVPQAPTIGTATNSGVGGAVSLAFTAGNSGGKSITNYKISTDGTTYTALSPSQTTSPLSITGLTNGTSYTFYIKAVNANGDSAASSVSNSVTPTREVLTHYLVVAGGGGGGTVEGGGGGAGGLRSTITASGRGSAVESQLSITAGSNYTVQIGSGGTGGTGGNQPGTDGYNSIFGSITSVGGGGGGQGASGNASLEPGRPGGCGGGGGSSGGANSKAGGAGTTAQGFNGGTGGNNDRGAGGGGGTGSIGADGSSSSYVGGNGGLGTAVSITGTSVTYAGGGGGGIFAQGTGGTGFGGGGSAGNSTSSSGGNGTTNTGGGGGGGNYTSGSGGAGGSGVVILRWLTADGTITVGSGLTADATGTDGVWSYKRFTAGTGTVSIA